MGAAPHVLLVDDEPLVLRSIGRVLVRSGMRVAFAGSGLEALALLDAGGIDLVISDVSMPGMDGLAMLRELDRRSAEHPPVVFFTGCDDFSDEELLGVGAKAVYQKPLGSAELLGIIRRWTSFVPAVG